LSLFKGFKVSTSLELKHLNYLIYAVADKKTVELFITEIQSFAKESQRA
jgi:hypothetical protein